MKSSSGDAVGKAVRVIFFGDDYFFSDAFFFEMIGTAGCMLVACVAPPLSGPRPRMTRINELFKGVGDWLNRERLRHLVACWRLGYFGNRPPISTASIADSTSERSWVKYVATRADVPLLRPKTVKKPNDEFLRTIKDLRPDVFVSVGYTKIIGEQLLAIPSMGAFNIHPSRLPLYRGGNSVFFALKDGASEIGMTCHRIVPSVDAGNIAYQEVLPVGKRAKVRETYDALIARSRWMAGRLLQDLLDSSVPNIEQSGATSFYLFPKADDLWIDWAKPATLIESLVCASGSEAWATFRRCKVNVVDGACIPGVVNHAKPGTVLGLSDGGIDVACAEGSVFRIMRLSFASPLPFMRPMEVDASVVADRLHLRVNQELSGR